MYPQRVPTREEINSIQDENITPAQFMLSPSVPPSQRKYFDQYYMMFSHIMALGNIERKDIFTLLLAYDEICLLFEIGLYDEARKLMGREMMKMQASRSVNAIQLLFGQQGIQRTEEIRRVLKSAQKRGTLSKIGRMFKGKRGQSQDVEYDSP